MFALIVIVILNGCQSQSGETIPYQQTTPPNIIYILADDLGYGDLGSYGQTNIHTPNLDRMANEGMRFTQHYAGSTVCAPSRAVLMTGLHTGHTPVRGNKEMMPIGQYPLPYGVPTLAEAVKEAGYTTGAFGKWGLGYVGSEGMPSRQGFDEFFGYICQRRAHFYYPEFLYRESNGKDFERVPMEGNSVEDTSRENFQHPGSGPPITRGQYSPHVITEEAISFIERNRETNFFLYFSTSIPHASLTVPGVAMAPYVNEKGESLFSEDPFLGDHYTAQPMPGAAYAAMVTLLDSHVGRILDTLKEQGIAGNTLMIFSSDNGSHSAGGYHYSMHNSNKPFRGGKRDLYEGGIRVPMIAWWPGKIEAGSISSHISAFQDILPTFSELAGIQSPPNIDGISMVPELLGKGNQPMHEYLYWEFHELGGKQAVRKEKWKAVRRNVYENPNGPVELYNLEDDIAEQENVADEYPEVIKEMNRIMDDAHVPSEVFSFSIQ